MDWKTGVDRWKMGRKFTTAIFFNSLLLSSYFGKKEFRHEITVLNAALFPLTGENLKRTRN